MSGALMPTPSAPASIQCLVTASQPAASQAQRREAVALADQVSAAIKSVTAQHGAQMGWKGVLQLLESATLSPCVHSSSTLTFA